MSQKRLFLSTSCTQNCPETKRLKFEKLMYLYLKCMLFLKVSQHALIFETTLLKSESAYTHFWNNTLLKCDLRCAIFPKNRRNSQLIVEIWTRKRKKGNFEVSIAACLPGWTFISSFLAKRMFQWKFRAIFRKMHRKTFQRNMRSTWNTK